MSLTLEPDASLTLRQAVSRYNTTRDALADTDDACRLARVATEHAERRFAEQQRHNRDLDAAWRILNAERRIYQQAKNRFIEAQRAHDTSLRANERYQIDRKTCEAVRERLWAVEAHRSEALRDVRDAHNLIIEIACHEYSSSE